MSRELFYQVPPGIDVVPLSNGDVLFRSDAVAVRLEGAAARILAEQVIPLLDGQRSLSEISARLPHLSVADLQQRLDELVRTQALRRSDQAIQPSRPDALTMRPFLELLESIGIPAIEACEKLKQLRVAIFGLEGHGAHVAAGLAQCGLGHLMLVDPFPCQPENFSLMPLMQSDLLKGNREDQVAAVLQGTCAASRITVSDGAVLDGDSMRTPASLVIWAAGMPAPEQLVPTTATICGSATRARAAAVPPSAPH
jgi:hypothetical protein